MIRPTDLTELKAMMYKNGMTDAEWAHAENAYAEGRIYGIIWFILDPTTALNLLPQSLIDTITPGLLDFIEVLGSKMERQSQKDDLFRRSMMWKDTNVANIMLRDVHIDDFLMNIPQELLDKVMGNTDEINKLVAYCNEHKQQDAAGYSKLLLLK